MGIKELSAGLIGPLCHPALYCSGRAASVVPDLPQTWGFVSPHTLKQKFRLGWAATQKGLIPVQHIYVTNTFICRSLPNGLYKIGFELSKLHALIYLALFADAYIGLQCCFIVQYMCAICLSICRTGPRLGPKWDIELRMYRLNIWLFKIIVQMWPIHLWKTILMTIYRKRGRWWVSITEKKEKKTTELSVLFTENRAKS